mgnify:CR=1 FL=1
MFYLHDLILLLHHYEKKQDELRKSLNSAKVKFYLGDVRDKTSLTSVIEDVDYILELIKEIRNKINQ